MGAIDITSSKLSLVDMSDVSAWLRKRGKAVKPKLSTEQLTELNDCFKLMDEDGSGSIDVSELEAAFKMLGIMMSKKEFMKLVNEVDHDGTGDIGWVEFLEIMTETLQRSEDSNGDESRFHQLPVSLLATQYRRLKYLEGVMAGDRDSLRELVQLAERQAQSIIMAQRAQESGLVKDNSRHGKGMPSSISRSGSRALGGVTAIKQLEDLHLDSNMRREMGKEQVGVLKEVLSRTSPKSRARRQQQQPVLRSRSNSLESEGMWNMSPSVLNPQQGFPQHSPFLQRPNTSASAGITAAAATSPRSSFAAAGWQNQHRPGTSISISSISGMGRRSTALLRVGGGFLTSPQVAPVTARERASVPQATLLASPQANLRLSFTRPTLKIPGVSRLSSYSRGDSIISPQSGERNPLIPKAGSPMGIGNKDNSKDRVASSGEIRGRTKSHPSSPQIGTVVQPDPSPEYDLSIYSSPPLGHSGRMVGSSGSLPLDVPLPSDYWQGRRDMSMIGGVLNNSSAGQNDNPLLMSQLRQREPVSRRQRALEYAAALREASESLYRPPSSSRTVHVVTAETE
ncbi:hypothetical protein CEUSTIGMA_g9155.t1 [Chlamydomonas eustigma]|uniref:EF-hand domain-containing protein n=1 Tax=Chlamydomonas eustigma TaxID=1157962 RepID=A0A250XF75_9CHLO|nr:hypothetical protein CEUSTIGMA_g9155.t1 [Chlamydomonas eustigma]|eukprot:GAX81727.1 hypothetical protein CEUSTIGMA_g9155.t1 [Chlamydomonas eustigma]